MLLIERALIHLHLYISLALGFKHILNAVFMLRKTGILIENMRREGFELSVSPPKVM